MFKGFGLIGIAIVILFTGLAIIAPLISPYAPDVIVTEQLRLPPSWYDGGVSKYILGTDDLGRDQFSRIIYGARITMFMGFMVVVVSTLIGVSLGLIAGSVGGIIDQIITRGMDILMALPSVLFAIVILTVLGPGLGNTILAVAIMALPSIVRITRGTVIGEMKKNYVVAAKSYGAGWFRVAIVNVLPNCMAPIIVQVALGFSDAVLNTAALGALGLGAQAPTPEWGTMLADARGFIESSPHLVTIPGLCILLVVVGFNLFGDSLRDYLDPKLRKTT